MSFHASSRGLVGYVWGALAGAASAFLLVFALSNPGTPFLGLTYVASVPLFLAGLSMGAGAAALGGVIGTVAVAAFMPPAYAAFFALLYALPATFLTELALRTRANAQGQAAWDQGGNILTAMSVYPALLFLLLFIAVGDSNGGLLAITQTAMAGAEDKFLALVTEGREPNDQQRAIVKKMIEVTPAFIPGMAMFAWIFTTAVSMGFAYSIAWRQKWALRPGFSLGDMQVPNWVVYAAAATGLLAAFAPAPFDYLGRNLAIVLATPFFFVGLAVTHALINQTRASLFLLVVFYLVMGVFPAVVLLVAMLGAVDQWVGFRKRFASGSQNEGENK
jgi:hypothetical protein